MKARRSTRPDAGESDRSFVPNGTELGAREDVLWTQRFKANLAKLISGDIYQVAEVVRDLSLRERRRALSPGETRMLAKAREILISELTFAVDATEENAEAMLDQILEGSGRA